MEEMEGIARNVRNDSIASGEVNILATKAIL
jgi:hypothetical protein